MRIATYNVEWFNSLFDDAGALRCDDGWSGRWDVTRSAQIAALGAVFAALDADAIMIIEAPDSSRRRDGQRALERFAARFGLRTRVALIGFANDTQQEIALLYDPDVVSATHSPLSGGPDNPRFDAAMPMDIDLDARLDAIGWSKPPLEVTLTSASGALQLIGVHAKSKAPHGADNAADAMRIAIANRRKQLAQCIWLRKRVDQHLDAGAPLVVLGDFNDGPGLDAYEKLFGRSGIEIVLGEGSAVPLFDPHAQMMLGPKVAARPATARFRRKGQPFLSALLDYIMVSPDLRRLGPRWRIWHPFDDPECYDNIPLREALLTGSDHFPVTMDIDL